MVSFGRNRLLDTLFTTVNLDAFLRFRTTGKVLNLRRFSAKSKTFQTLVLEFLFADDAEIIADTEHEIQALSDLFSNACNAFVLTIYLKKIEVIFTQAVRQAYIESNLLVQGRRLKVLDNLV